MVVPHRYRLGMAILGGIFVAVPAHSQPETAIGLPQVHGVSTAFARWQQINRTDEPPEPELKGVIMEEQVSADLEEGQPEGTVERVVELMESLPVRMDYTGVGLVYERSY